MIRIRTQLSRHTKIILGIIPFIVLAAGYFTISYQRHQENPRDRLTPNLEQLKQGWKDVTCLRVRSYEIYEVKEGETLDLIAQRISKSGEFKSEISGDGFELADDYQPQVGDQLRIPVTERRIITDTMASLKRLAIGVSVAVAISVILGILMGSLTQVESLLYYLISGLAKIPPLAILPIIFIFMGAGEAAKIMIIALGIAPTLILDITQRAREVPSELLTKSYTLGATTDEVIAGVITPIIWPSILNSIRLSLGAAWVYLIASEALAADAGLGYRIFVVQRQLGMNVILIYVAWIMVLGLTIDWILRKFSTWRYKWAEAV